MKHFSICLIAVIAIAALSMVGCSKFGGKISPPSIICDDKGCTTTLVQFIPYPTAKSELAKSKTTEK